MRILGVALVLSLSGVAHAVRPFVTDDARVVGDKLAQLESWARGDRTAFQHWGMFAVGAWAPVERSLGAVQGASYDGTPAAYTVAGPLVLGKVLLWEPTQNRWPGLALSIGGTAPVGHGEFTPRSWERFAYLALTESLFGDERLLIHANLGLSVVGHEHGEGSTTNQTWGIGSQLRLITGLHLVAEVVSGDPYDPTSGDAGQAGIRYIVNKRLQLDAAVGGGPWGATPQPTWGTAGLRLVGGPIGRWFRRGSTRS